MNKKDNINVEITNALKSYPPLLNKACISEDSQRFLTDALRFPIDWSKENLESATRRYKEHLRENYNCLSEASIELLGKYFSYNWK